MDTIRRMLKLAQEAGKQRMSVRVETVENMLDEYDIRLPPLQQKRYRMTMLRAFRQSAISLGIEARLINEGEHDADEGLRICSNPFYIDLITKTEKKLHQLLADYDELRAMMTAFRHAANSIGVEAGITKDHVSHDVAEASVCQKDGYYLDLIRGAEQKMERLSVKYERLRAAAWPVTGVDDSGFDNHDYVVMDDLQEALKDD